jgi:hypothetical protein
MSWQRISSQLIEVARKVLPVPPVMITVAVIPVVARSPVHKRPIVTSIIRIRIIAVRIVAIPESNGNPDSDRNTRLRWRCCRESKSTNREPN